eukprot:2091934-Rhodomonas_salina.2
MSAVAQPHAEATHSYPMRQPWTQHRNHLVGAKMLADASIWGCNGSRDEGSSTFSSAAACVPSSRAGSARVARCGSV